MLNINYRHYLALLNIASKEETRYYLNGVFVQPAVNGGVVLVATDGHRLGAIHDPDGTCDEPTIIGRHDLLVKAVRPGKGKEYRLTLTNDSVAIVNEESVVASFNGDFRVDGTFPDYGRIWPATYEPGDFAVNATYVGDFAKIAKILGKINCSVSMAGGGDKAPLVVKICGLSEFVGLLMPMRHDAQNADKPDWFAPVPSEKIAAE